jgi:hypothetical protein
VLQPRAACVRSRACVKQIREVVAWSKRIHCMCGLTREKRRVGVCKTQRFAAVGVCVCTCRHSGYNQRCERKAQRVVRAKLECTVCPTHTRESEVGAMMGP